MPENNTVIVATDGSDHSLRVLQHAEALAKNLGAGIEFVRVVELHDLDGGGEDKTAAIEQAKARIEAEMEANLQRFGTTATARVIVAPEGEDPASTLLGIAARGAILAMHSRGRGGIARVLHGSVAMGVLKQATQPVMIGGPELLPPPAVDDAYRILVTTDLSPAADYALRGVGPLLEQGNFDVTLLYVHLHAPQGVDNEAEKSQRLAELNEKRSLLPASVPVNVVVREIPVGGGIDTAIMEVAQDVGAQAIAMATHGHSAKHQVLMGSVSLSVLGRSPLPLIVARSQD